MKCPVCGGSVQLNSNRRIEDHLTLRGASAGESSTAEQCQGSGRPTPAICIFPKARNTDDEASS